jgi:hypothetical protein
MEYTMTEENEKISITFTFDGPQSSTFDLSSTGEIDPYQLLMLASYLEFEGKYALNRIRTAQEAQWAQQMEEQQRVATLKPKVLTPQ